MSGSGGEDRNELGRGEKERWERNGMTGWRGMPEKRV